MSSTSLPSLTTIAVAAGAGFLGCLGALTLTSTYRNRRPATPKRVDNFNPGPAALPTSVLATAQRDLLAYGDTGMSVMELSHRSSDFVAIAQAAESRIRSLLNVPSDYSVLFMQGGGHTQFSSVPLNLLGDKTAADYVVTGAWSAKAAKEAQRYCDVRVIYDAREDEEAGRAFTHAPSARKMRFSSVDESAYVYYCANETVHGVEFADVPEVPEGVVLVGDFSSSFMSRSVDVSKFGLIYAGAQKNVGPAGVTIVLVRNDLLGKAHAMCPVLMDYKALADKQSMLNTPPTWGIYMCGLVFHWIHEQGGVDAMADRNARKAERLYTVLDKHSIYVAPVQHESRSRMNVVFRVGHDGQADPELEAKFVALAQERDLCGLKGHRSVGGIRASIYNSVSEEAVERLVEFMEWFAGEF